MGKREMKLTAVGLPRMGGTLIDLVQELQGDLVGNKKPQQIPVATTWECPEQSRAVQMGTLASK